MSSQLDSTSTVVGTKVLLRHIKILAVLVNNTTLSRRQLSARLQEKTKNEASLNMASLKSLIDSKLIELACGSSSSDSDDDEYTATPLGVELIQLLNS